MVEIIDPAAINRQFAENIPWRLLIPTGSVYIESLVSIMLGHKNSPQEPIKVKTAKTSSLQYKPLNSPNSEANLSYGSPVRFTTKNGYEYQIFINDISKDTAISESDMLENGSNYFNKAAEVGIDVNGEKGPNIVGRDYFRFELGNDGRLYPFGGNDYCAYNGVEYTDVTEKCVTDLDGSYCAAHLMQNGYKMDY